MNTIVRIAQSQYVEKGYFTLCFEMFNPETKTWHYSDQVYHYFCKAKVRIDPESDVKYFR